MLIRLALFGFDVVEVEMYRGGDPGDVDLADYEIGSDTERADLEAWREDVDDDAQHPPRIIAAGVHRARSRRRRAPVIAIGTRHSTDKRLVDVNRETKCPNGFGFSPRR